MDSILTKEFIYLDNNATTPLDPKVWEVMSKYSQILYANPSSTHRFGKQIKSAIENARSQVANLLQAQPREIIFTSGATEAINLSLKGVALALQNKGYHVITTQTEHKAVLDTCAHLEDIGFEVEYLPVQSDGRLDLNILSEAICEDTSFCIPIYPSDS